MKLPLEKRFVEEARADVYVMKVEMSDESVSPKKKPQETSGKKK